MRIVIDMQGVQAEINGQPSGSTNLDLVKNIVSNRANNEVILVLSNAFAETIEPIRTAFESLLPQESIRLWHALGESVNGARNRSKRSVNALLREAFIANIQPDILHLTHSMAACDQGALYHSEALAQQLPVTLSTTLSEEGIAEIRNNSTHKVSGELFDAAAFYINSAALTKQSEHASQLAIETIASWKKLINKKTFPVPSENERLTLAFVSPLPPERTGIADYSAELLQPLSRYYNLVLIVEQEEVSHRATEGFAIQNSQWLRENKDTVDRVIYQVGNSPFHAHMLSLLEEVPGTVVLHDFFIGHLRYWQEAHEAANIWRKALYSSHGYQAVAESYQDIESTIFKYPANFDAIKNAVGLVFHSDYALTLAHEWFDYNGKTNYVPLLRESHELPQTKELKSSLNFEDEPFIVCSFGGMGTTKQNHRLIEAWLKSSLASNANSYLVFVGGLPSSGYSKELKKQINNSSRKEQIIITDYVDTSTYQQYLAIADITVQLRTSSRGETSAAVLDCMNYARPLILNANGSMAELDNDAVYKLPDEFTDAELVSALEDLYHNPVRRMAMGNKARAIIEQQHSPDNCAAQYFQAIESHYQSSQHALGEVIEKLSETELFDNAELVVLSEALDHNLPAPKPAKQILVDITATCFHDLKTGIERVARAITLELLQSPPKGYRIEPAYLSNINGQWRYVYAREYTSQLMGLPQGILSDEPAEISCGDIVIGLDISGEAIIESVNNGYIAQLRNDGVNIYFMVHDLLPINLPHVFPPNSDINHAKWLSAIAQTDGVVGVTKNVAEDYSSWLQKAGMHKTRRSFYIGYSHHGADINNSSPSKGLPENSQATLQQIQARPSFLMVGTIEPRKGYLEAINAFDELWQNGVDVNLVIVGKEGWQGLDDEMRRDIPETIAKLRNHPENGKRLFWLEGISDEYLEKVYANASCLIAASYGEGFGLPLIEAAQHKLPIIARDIPVFREVAGEHAFYFDSKEPEALAASIQQWLALYQQDKHPRSDNMPWLTWEQSSENLIRVISGRDFKY